MAIKEENDIVKDILYRVQQIMGPSFDGTAAAKLESDVRRDWGGDRYYVARGFDARERNMTIINLHQNGSISIKQLSERFQISKRQIFRILKRHTLP